MTTIMNFFARRGRHSTEELKGETNFEEVCFKHVTQRCQISEGIEFQSRGPIAENAEMAW